MGACPQSEEKTDLTHVQREARLNALLCERDFGQALLLIDTLRAQYPRVPQFCFCEGWVYDMKGDSVRARSCYTQAVSIYDSLIAVKKDFGDQDLSSAQEALAQGRELYDEPSFTIKDSVIPFRMTVKGDTLFMVNQHSKSQKVPKEYIRALIKTSSGS